MSRIVRALPLEDCFDGGFARRLELSAPIDTALMQRLAAGAQLDFYPDFPRPYFRIERRGLFVAQGVLGNCEFRVTLARAQVEAALSTVTRLVEGGADGTEA